MLKVAAAPVDGVDDCADVALQNGAGVAGYVGERRRGVEGGEVDQDGFDIGVHAAADAHEVEPTQQLPQQVVVASSGRPVGGRVDVAAVGDGELGGGQVDDVEAEQVGAAIGAERVDPLVGPGEVAAQDVEAGLGADGPGDPAVGFDGGRVDGDVEPGDGVVDLAEGHGEQRMVDAVGGVDPCLSAGRCAPLPGFDVWFGRGGDRR